MKVAVVCAASEIGITALISGVLWRFSAIRFCSIALISTAAIFRTRLIFPKIIAIRHRDFFNLVIRLLTSRFDPIGPRVALFSALFLQHLTSAEFSSSLALAVAKGIPYSVPRDLYGKGIDEATSKMKNTRI
jgi:hypothetical protein